MSAIFLLLLGLFGIYCTHLEANGTALIHDLIAAGTLPNNHIPLCTVYTGFQPLDRILTHIVVFLWPVTNQRLLLTLHATNFLAGTNAIWTLLLIEGYRRGNAKTAASYPTIFTLGQFLTFPVGISIYTTLHLATSRTNNPTRHTLSVPVTVLRIIPVVTIIGLIIPIAVLRSVSDDTKQIFIAAWQFWPVYASMIVFFVNAVLSRFTKASSPEPEPEPETETDIIQFLYGLCLLTTAIPHFRYITFIFLRAVFTGDIGLSCLRDVFDFVLQRPWTNPVSVEESLHVFLDWGYLVKSLAFLVWAGSLYRSYSRMGFTKLALLVVLVILAGPIAAAVELLWEREMVIRGQSDTSTQSSRAKSGSGMGKWERGWKVLRFD